MDKKLCLERVTGFDDSDNDLSMFEAADESLTLANGNERIKSAATAVTGHHDKQGIACCLREQGAPDWTWMPEAPRLLKSARSN